MKPHILLFYPETEFGLRESQMLPLPPMYAAIEAVGRGYGVTLIDERVDKDWRTRIRGAFEQHEVIAFGVSSMTGTQIRGGLAASSLVRQIAPQTPIVWGGVHASLLPEQTVRHDLVDIVVVGEGEQPLADLADRLSSGADWRDVPGVAYIDEDGNYRKNAASPWLDLDALDHVPYHLVDVNLYTKAPFAPDRKSVAVCTSRGCPWRCGYCYELVYNSRTWRAQSPEKVISEFKYVLETTGINDFYLFDDEFFIDLKRVARICELLEKEGLDVNIHNANCRAESLCRADMGLLKALRRVGFRQILIGVESGSPRILELMKKDMTADQVVEANTRCLQADIQPVYSFMCGFPWETAEDVKLTLRLQERLLRENPRAYVGKTAFWYPFPGTPMYDEVIREYGFEAPQSLDEWATYIDRPKVFRGADPHQHDFARDASLFTAFLDAKMVGFRNPVIRTAVNAYSALIRWRIRNDAYWVPVGMPMLRMLRDWWQRRSGRQEESQQPLLTSWSKLKKKAA